MGAVHLTVRGATGFSPIIVNGWSQSYAVLIPVEHETVRDETRDVYALRDDVTNLTFHRHKQCDCWHEDVSGDIDYLCHPDFSSGIDYDHVHYDVDHILVTTSNAHYNFVYAGTPSSRYEYRCEDDFDVKISDKRVYVSGTSKRDRRPLSGGKWEPWNSSRINFSEPYGYAWIKGVITHYPSANDLSYLLISPREQARIDEIFDERLSFGDLSLKAAQNKRMLNINSLMYIRDFCRLPGLVKGLVGDDAIRALSKFEFQDDLSSNIQELKGLLKGVSNEYLANHYGTRLTLLDTQKIAHAISAYNPWGDEETLGASGDCSVSKQYGRFTALRGSRKVTAVVDAWSQGQLHICDTVSEAIHQLDSNIQHYFYDRDLVPSLANLWDMLPYSFVADWIVPIGDSLEYQEDKHYLESFRPRIVWYSQHWDISEDISETFPNWTRNASLKHKCYQRLCRTGFIEPRPRLDSPLTDGFDHWVEAAALIMQVL
jgi:hypothetical protein